MLAPANLEVEGEPMSYKTILVHLNDRRRAEALLEPAVYLAEQHNAHLIGVHVYASLPAPPVSFGPAAKVMGGIVAAERKETEDIAAIFTRMTAGRSFTAEWRMDKVPHANLASVVLAHGRAVDLIVAGQTDPDWDMSPLMDFPETLAMEGGRPVLVIPRIGRYPQPGQHVLISWKSTREAARATFDALPVLVRAKTVQILEIRQGADAKSGPTDDIAIASALARHGIKPIVRTSVGEDLHIGDEILNRITDYGADLLVMGAYGHSRMRELVFGGATRHIARHMTVPTLFSH